jgi:hypothetical protein
MVKLNLAHIGQNEYLYTKNRLLIGCNCVTCPLFWYILGCLFQIMGYRRPFHFILNDKRNSRMVRTLGDIFPVCDQR